VVGVSFMQFSPKFCNFAAIVLFASVIFGKTSQPVRSRHGTFRLVMIDRSRVGDSHRDGRM
jgi:hypothetical protein